MADADNPHAELIEALRSSATLPFCPYDRRSPEYWTAPDDKPCPVCGGLNEDGAPDLCRGADSRLFTRAAEALAAYPPAEGGWRPEVRAFAHLMEAQLRANDWKGGWKNEDASDLFPRISEEADELWQAMVRHNKRLSWGDAWVMETDTAERIGREAADVANFAMMIADVCGALAAGQAEGAR